MIAGLLAPARLILRSLEGIAAVASVEREMRGLRGDMREVIDGVGVHLESLSALTARLSRFGARAAK
jgi:hypothetical protein